MKELTNLIMLDKILPAQFRMLYRELTSDCSVSDNSQSKQCDERWQTLTKHAETGMLRDLQVNNSRTPKYDKFWDLVNRQLEEMQAVDDRRHSHTNKDGLVVTNMAVAVSAPDLYKKCKEAAIASGFGEDEIPALLTIKFQFWPKDPFTYSAMNYKGKVKVKYMVQQRNIHKSHNDEHYCSAIYKYLHEQIVTHKDHAAFVSTDDKNKIKIGEPKCPITAAARGKRVLVATNQLLQAADHDLSTISVTPTVVLLHHIPADLQDSWYRGMPNIFLKLQATEPSTAVRNAKEITDIIIDYYGGKKELVLPILGIYTDEGPEHRLNFLSVQIAYIAL